MKNETRDRIFETLKIDEGVVDHVYLDHLGYPTFGVGHLIKESDPENGWDVGTPVEPNRIKMAFEGDLDIAIRDCGALYGYDVFDEWPDEVQEILVNMMFNMGRTRLGKFKNFRAALGS